MLAIRVAARIASYTLVLLFSAALLADSDVKRIAITFDDAPRDDGPFFSGAERTETLVAALQAADVSGAMFFVATGRISETSQGLDRIKAYAEAGHVLANHSHSHSWLWQSEAADYLADIDRASETLEPLEGYQPFYRFPFLDEGRTAEKRDAVRVGLAERDLEHGYVTVDNYDWYMQALVKQAVDSGFSLDRATLGQAYVELLMQSVNFYDDIARGHLGRSPAHVLLLLHENDLAALFIDDLVIELRKQGWQIIPALEAYRDEIAQTLPDTLFNGQGRVAALAHVQGTSPRDLIHISEDETWLRVEFIRRGLLPEAEAE